MAQSSLRTHAICELTLQSHVLDSGVAHKLLVDASVSGHMLAEIRPQDPLNVYFCTLFLFVFVFWAGGAQGLRLALH